MRCTMRSKTRKTLAIALALIIKRRKRVVQQYQPKKRRVWVKEPLLLKREQSPFELPEQDLSPYDFRNFLLKDSACYDELLTILTPLIEKKNTNMRDAIPAHQRLSVTLSYLGTGTKFENLKATTAISAAAISKIVMETCEAIIRTLGDYIKLPSKESEWEKIAKGFAEKWNFPNCIGAIGGIHIAIKSSSATAALYCNYKNFSSIVLTALFNANYEFVIADVEANGRMSDFDVFEDSFLANALRENILNIPKPRKLGNSTNKKQPYVLVGDYAFPQTQNILKPYENSCLTPEKQIFNYRLKRAQQVAENAFGVLVTRFQVLQHKISMAPEKVKIVVLACCYLHNFLQRKCQRDYIPDDLVDNEDIGRGTVFTGLWRNETHLTTLEPLLEDSNTNNVRDDMAHYFSNEGQVPWQEKFLQIKDNIY